MGTPGRDRLNHGRLVAQITAEARDGLNRAWLDLLKKRHPEVSWIVTDDRPTPEEETVERQEGGIPDALDVSS